MARRRQEKISSFATFFENLLISSETSSKKGSGVRFQVSGDGGTGVRWQVSGVWDGKTGLGAEVSGVWGRKNRCQLAGDVAQASRPVSRGRLAPAPGESHRREGWLVRLK